MVTLTRKWRGGGESILYLPGVDYAPQTSWGLDLVPALTPAS